MRGNLGFVKKYLCREIVSQASDEYINDKLKEMEDYIRTKYDYELIDIMEGIYLNDKGEYCYEETNEVIPNREILNIFLDVVEIT